MLGSTLTKGIMCLLWFASLLIVGIHMKKTSSHANSMFTRSTTASYPSNRAGGAKIIYCPAGPPGPPGPPGTQGLPGRDGRDGRDLPALSEKCPPPPPCPLPTPCPSPAPCGPVNCDRPALGTEKNPAWSCQELFAANPQLNSGPYWLKTPHHEPYQVHCEMLNAVGGVDRGGWTLVARVDGQTNDFAGISPTWTNSDVINEEQGADLTKTGSMKNYGWGNIISNALMACFSGPRSHCATFTHNKKMTLAELFDTQFAVETTERYTFRKLMGKFGKNIDVSALKTEWCGINLGDLCSLAHPPSKYHGTHVCRIGCIGDSIGQGPQGDCHDPQDFALGIGVAVCRRSHRNKRCSLKKDSSKSLQYESPKKRGCFTQTAFIYIK